MRQRILRVPIALLLSVAVLAVGLGAFGLTTDLSGTWIMLQVYPRIASLPVVGESTQTSFVVQFVDIEQDGASLVMQDRYCFTVIEESSPLAATEIFVIAFQKQHLAGGRQLLQCVAEVASQRFHVVEAIKSVSREKKIRDVSASAQSGNLIENVDRILPL